MLTPIALSDFQLKLVTEAARALPYEKRDAFLGRVGAHLGSLGYRCVKDADVQRATMMALKGLLHGAAA